ncbi:MAG: ABC transporter ATP-binding protein [Vicinamibacteria bacterium]|nr:ABC transporter ATP-binding protein [Vicinamibacteria bacterium]
MDKAAPNTPAVSVTGLTKVYGNVTALCIERVQFDAGCVHAIVGPNGAGKTTLFRLIAGLEPSDQGDLRVLGGKIHGRSGEEHLSLRRRIGFAAQRPYLFSASARWNVEYPLRVRGITRAESENRARAAMARLGVAHLAARKTGTLSAGERQRISIARAIVTEPELLLVDEPFANLDPEGVPILESTLLDLVSSGTTILVATHLTDRAYRLSTRILRLEGGRPAPPAVVNILEGEVVSTNSGPMLVLEGGTRIHVATDRIGRRRASIFPEDVIVSARPFDSSARNILRGRITALQERGSTVFATVDAGVSLTAAVTPESCRRLALTVGSNVVLTFKAAAVKLFYKAGSVSEKH